jgi:tRNA(Ser,Leu) C12 N-acetylase TAN1
MAPNPNCKGDATDADLELVTMIVKGERDPEEAINIIKKTVKVKCVTTAQVRKLTLLFEQDEHRYAMLDIAYRYTSDRQNFSSLADLLKDTYYLNRFKAMLQ